MIENCVSLNSSSTVLATSLHLAGSENKTRILYSQFRDNNASPLGNAYGIFLNGAQNCEILSNQLSDNNGLLGIGLVDTTTNTTNLIAGNFSFNNSTTAYQVINTVGIFPVAFGTMNDFSQLTDISQYINIAIR